MKGTPSSICERVRGKKHQYFGRKFSRLATQRSESEFFIFTAFDIFIFVIISSLH